MNTITITNVAVLTVGVAALTTAVEFLKSGQLVEAIIAGVIGLGAIFLYERLPLSNPSA